VQTHGHGDHVGDTLEIAKSNGRSRRTTISGCGWSRRGSRSSIR
jgi:hypothetical protein